MSYYQKYLKYKSKYTNLKRELFGGGDDIIMINNQSFDVSDRNCLIGRNLDISNNFNSPITTAKAWKKGSTTAWDNVFFMLKEEYEKVPKNDEDIIEHGLCKEDENGDVYYVLFKSPESEAFQGQLRTERAEAIRLAKEEEEPKAKMWFPWLGF